MTQTVQLAARAAESVLAQTRHALRSAELRLHAWRLAHDREVGAWIDEVRDAAATEARGDDRLDFDELQKLIDDQRS